MDDHELDEIFDDDKLNMAIKKGKKRSTKKTVLISLLVAVTVFIVIFITNAVITTKLSNTTFESNKADIKLHVINGYISKSVDSMGFLGGRGDYAVTREVGGKPVVLENRVSLFGLIPPFSVFRSRGVYGVGASEWKINYWENGDRKMIFFHPEISYKDYKNDLNELDKISGDKLIELGLSFDKPYKLADIPTILPNVKKSWYWVDAFRKSDIEQYKKDVKKYGAKASYIYEDDVLGVSDNGNYSDLLESLKSSKDKKYIEIYNELLTKGYTYSPNIPLIAKDKKSEGVLIQNTDSSNVPILGAVVYGTKDELKSLIGNPHIKAASFGVVVDKY